MQIKAWCIWVMAIVVIGIGVGAGNSRGQEAPKAGPREAIEAEFGQQLAGLERQRITRLAELAARQNAAEATQTYELLFRHAITDGAFDVAGPIAERVLAAKGTAPQVAYLAGIVDIMALVDKKQYDKAVDRLVTMADANRRGDQRAAVEPLPVPQRISLLELFYQRLVQADQFELAKKAFRLIHEKTAVPLVKDFLATRLKELDLIGQPAPALAGKDLDGKTVALADFRGQVVLVVFWASWCVPCTQEVQLLDEVERAYHDRGFRVLGVNLDALAEGGRDIASVQPAVRRFLVEHNVRWPNLISPAGADSFARAYGVSDIPASVLVGRDGKVLHLDLTPANLAKVVARSVGGAGQ